MNLSLNRRNPDFYFQQTFYNTLAHYRPFCQKSEKVHSHTRLSPLEIEPERLQETQYYEYFLINNGWWKSLICMIMLNAIFVLAFLTFVLDSRAKYYQQNPTDPSTRMTVKYVKSENYFIMKLACITSLLFINITYFLTQFLNPGIRNLMTLPRQQLLSAQKTQFCVKCNQYRTQQFVHCSQCQVCIWKYDHHCGFFSKCIGGKIQTYAFYAFMTSIIAGFVVLLICVTIELG